MLAIPSLSLRHVCLTVFLASALSAAPPLRSGWVYVPGAQDMIGAGKWGCVSGLTASANSLTVQAGSGYNTITNTTGPLLQVTGDFSVLTTLSTSSSNSGSGVFLTLVGALNTGANWWDGLKRLDVGLAGNAIGVSYWTGGSASGTGVTMPLPEGLSGTVDLEVARISNQIVVFAGGMQVGAFADPGLFAAGRVYLGFNVAPGNTLTVTSLAAAMPQGGSGALSAPYLQTVARSGTGLRDAAAAGGLLIGAAVDPSHFSDAGYAQTLGREFNLVVAENAMKFAATEPAPHQFNFCAADQILQYAQANGMQVRGHNLVWQQALPGWLTSGSYTPAQAADILREHIETVLGHYKGQLIDWDVVNEAIAYGAPYGAQPSYWLNQLGSGYVDLAFQWAHAADPNAKLFYNDTGGEGLDAKSEAVYSLVSGMVRRGVPVNGVGLQMHITASSPPPMADISANIARYAALGLEVHITEMDVRVPVDSGGAATGASLSAQAVAYQNVLAACQANPNCTALLTWGVTDSYSWIPGSYPGFGAALLFDTKYNAKAAVNSIQSRLGGRGKPPVIFTNGIVIHGGRSTVVSPGSLVDIYGSDLAGAQVNVNGREAPVYYQSADLVVFQMPFETGTGSVLVQVKNAAGASLSNAITVEAAAPSILTYGDNWGVVQNQDFSVNSATNCAAAGSYLTAYLIGTGPLDQPIPTGAPTPLSPLANETLKTTATVGGVNAPVVFAGMAPSLTGVMQVNLQAPSKSGILPLQIRVGAFPSNTVSICVR